MHELTPTKIKHCQSKPSHFLLWFEGCVPLAIMYQWLENVSLTQIYITLNKLMAYSY